MRRAWRGGNYPSQLSLIIVAYVLFVVDRSSKYPLILISMDGFRPDYLQKNLTPNIDYLGKSSFLGITDVRRVRMLWLSFSNIMINIFFLHNSQERSESKISSASVSNKDFSKPLFYDNGKNT